MDTQNHLKITYMKKLYSIIIAVLISSTLIAQMPQKMSYQSVIRNSSNQLVTSHAVGMKISILQGSATGTAVYVETQTSTTNANGLVTIEIGGGTPVTGTFSGINWATGTYFIKTETDPNGGTSYSITGTSQLLSVPYALYSKTSEKANELERQIGAMQNILITNGLLLRDIDGNVYGIVHIGLQYWMSENLKTTKYNDGTPIPNITVNSAWTALTSGAYCDYNNTSTNSTTYGRLYNWFTVDNNAATKVASNGGKNVCPTGWHVPSIAEWTILGNYLGGNALAGGKLKETGTVHWNSPNTAATNEAGFYALPAGFRGYAGGFGGLGTTGNHWSSDGGVGNIPYWQVYYTDGGLHQFANPSQEGYSIRCVKD
jgi:uncharacterized protein (TIGR02145 family)